MSADVVLYCIYFLIYWSIKHYNKYAATINWFVIILKIDSNLKIYLFQQTLLISELLNKLERSTGKCDINSHNFPNEGFIKILGVVVLFV